MNKSIKDFAILVILYTAVFIGVGAFIIANDDKANSNTVEYQQF